MPIIAPKKEKYIPTNSFDFMNNISVDFYFLKDVLNKTTTLYLPVYNHTSSIENSLQKHYPRIQEKYPEYSLYLEPGDNQEFKKWKMVFFAKKLYKELKEKVTFQSNKKIFKI